MYCGVVSVDFPVLHEAGHTKCLQPDRAAPEWVADVERNLLSPVSLRQSSSAEVLEGEHLDRS